MPGETECPFALCPMSGSVRRVLAHIRDVHDSSRLDQDFIDSFRLQWCEFCLKWFSKLAQHRSKCLSRSVKSDQDDRHVQSQGVTFGVTDVQSQGVTDEVPPFNKNADETVGLTSCYVGASSSGLDEEQAWSFIRDMPISDILRRKLPRIVQGVPTSWKPLLQECTDLAMNRILKEPLDIAGWKLLMLIPRMVLRHAQGGASGIRQARSNFRDFLQFQWEQLLLPDTGMRKHMEAKDSISSDDRRHRLALKLIRCGELSRAAKLLVSPGLAPVSSEVAEKLASKHPTRNKAILDLQEAWEPINLSRSVFFLHH